MTGPADERSARAGRRRLGAGFWAFVVLMALLTVLFAGLGAWQLNRLAEKEALIAAVARGMDQPATPLPPAAAWLSSADAAGDTSPVGGPPPDVAYRHLSATGRYLPQDTVLVFTALSDPRGRFGGPGYWVMTPMALAGGGSVFVNLGFVPQDRAADFATGGHLPSGDVTVTGIGMVPERAGAFTPPPDRAGRIDWIRNVERLAARSPDLPQPVLPVYLDLPAGEAGALPQGGETVVEFPNNHFGYALTWFGFALLTPVMLAVWIARAIRRPRTSTGERDDPPD